MTYEEAVYAVKLNKPLKLSYEEAYNILGHVNASIYKRDYVRAYMGGRRVFLTIRAWEKQNEWKPKDLDKMLNDDKEDRKIREACITALDNHQMENLL